MCLGIPGRVVSIFPADDVLMAKVDFGGVQKNVCIEHVPNVAIGEYVIVHVGFALTRIDETEAANLLELLRQLGEVSEVGRVSEVDMASELGGSPESHDVERPR